MTEVRRKHRWTFTIVGVDDAGANRATLFLQKAARPEVKFAETVMHHDQEQSYYAGKTEWSPITLVFYDAEQDPNVSKWVWDWTIKSVNIPAVTVAPPADYKKQARIEMYNGTGSVTERWKLINCWPSTCNWQELDYTSSDIQTVNVTCRFDRADRVL